MKKIALIDGYGFVFRAYHSLPPLTRADGTPVGAVYGFTNMLIKLLASLDVSHVAVVFDAGSKTFRNDIYPEYKANRPPCPEDLKPQFPIVRETAEALNLHILEKPGFEADDIIATMAKKSAAEGYQVLIVSSDKDLMQLVDENIFMYDAMKNRLIREQEVEEKFFVKPNKVLDVLSLIGDSSDNVPGVRGIGPKTAAELINKYDTLENLLEHLDEIKQNKRREMLIEGVEKAKLSKTLITLKEDVDVGISTQDLEVKDLDPNKLISFLETQGFRSLVSRVKKEFNISDDVKVSIPTHSNQTENQVKKAEEIDFDKVKRIEISSKEIADKLYEEARRNGIVTIDYFSENKELNFITISTNKADKIAKEIYYFPASSNTKKSTQNDNLDLFSFNSQSKENSNENNFSLEIIKAILEDDSIKKILFEAKGFLKFTAQENIEVKSFEDVHLIHHLTTSSTKNNLREMIDINLARDIEANGFGEIFGELEKDKKPEVFEELEKKSEFFCFRNFAIYQLYQIFYPKIFELKLNDAYHSFEKPLLVVLAKMESNGVKIDIEKLKQLSDEFGQRIIELTKEIHDLAGEEFNIASTKQLSEILFEKLGLSSSKKSKKTGALSTKSSVLEELAAEGHIIAEKVLEFRKFSKLKNTYTDALPKEINPKTGRIHSNFLTTATVTGRLSSKDPNLQNIPIKTADGRKIREAFISEKGKMLISADYSQIELRVIAHVAKIDALIQAFKEGKDIHKITASEVFDVPEDQVDSTLRSKAKAINFGIIYGISAFGLARQLGISRQEASDYIKSYLETYPGIDAYMKKYIDLAREYGYVKTFSGRKCFIHEINNKNGAIRAEAERLSINAPIQGSAADIVKKAMIKLDERFKSQNSSAKIILQIHDELVIEVEAEKAEATAKIVKEEMENAMMLDLPLKVDVEIGKRWK